MTEQNTRFITIPTIGTELKLASPWVFMLFHESRNSTLMERLGITHCAGYGRDISSSQVVFPTGTKLIVDRIYIRRGSRDFDSITFRLKKGEHATDPKIWGRFWAKLGDVNRIRCDWEEETVRRDTKVHPLSQLAAEAED